MPRSSPPAAAASAMPSAGTPTLSAIYQGQRYSVDKDEFVIGRGQKTSDLVIRDSNVSRRHAVVMLHNGQYWMVDQQSTNGVEFMGAKIDRKRIDEGDVFRICDYEIAFTYR
jgi:pSer/pThr/pTyr-binding forkhead associated (FHA) protein